MLKQNYIENMLVEIKFVEISTSGVEWVLVSKITFWKNEQNCMSINVHFLLRQRALFYELDQYHSPTFAIL